MPQTAIIQTETVSPVNTKKAAASSDGGDKAAFANHLNQQLSGDKAQPSESGKAPDKAADNKDKAATADQSETDVAADGKKLPSEKEAAADDKAVVTDKDDGKKADADSQDGDKDTAAEDAVTSVQAEQTPLHNPAAAQADKTEGNQSKPAKANSTPVDKATASVPQAAQPQPKSVDTADKISTAQAGATAQAERITVNPDISNQTQKEKPAQAAAQPSLAAVLKADQAEAEPPRIRADILDALQRQQGKSEGEMTLRNMIAAQTQQPQVQNKLAALAGHATHQALNTDAGAALNAGSTVNGVLSSLQTGTQATISAATTPSLPVQPNMQNPAWGQVMSSRVVWMAKQGVQQAELRMNPAQLGPVEVKLHLHNDQASVTFHAQNSATRDALEQAIPRLRDSFAESGIQLANAEVGSQAQQHENTEQADDMQFFAQASGESDDIEDETRTTVTSDDTSAGLSLYA
jgi:flagellar hook-length control protein FliK